MRSIMAAGLAALSLVAAPGARQEAEIIGSWRLVSHEYRDAQGHATHPMGHHATGFLVYDRSGYVSGHLTRPDRPRFASGDRARGTDAEVRAAFDGYFGYFGRYTVDEARGTVTHHVEGASYPNLVGREELRFYTLRGDRLTLRTPPFRLGDRELTGVLVWERAR